MKLKIFILPLLIGCIHASAQEIPVVKFNELESRMKAVSPHVQVFNFWATWCAPCVKELPYFEKLTRNDGSLKVTLVNLDFADKIDRVKSFVARKKLTAEVILLDEIDYNTWIDRVDKSWGGAIPATLVLNMQTGKRIFIERELKEGELDTLIEAIKK